MFVLTSISDTVQIPPSSFHHLSGRGNTLTAVERGIDAKYPNRIIPDLGLAICRYDVLHVGDGHVHPTTADGGVHLRAKFRLLVFRPFVEEVLVGRIVQMNADGMKIGLGFFDDVVIPGHWMLRPSRYDADAGGWVWCPEFGAEEEGAEDGAAAAPEFRMEVGDRIRFRVKSVHFARVTATAKGLQSTTTSTHANGGGTPRPEEQPGQRRRSSSMDLRESGHTREVTVPPCMYVIGSILEDGLGLPDWWSSNDDEEEEVEEEEPLEAQEEEYDETPAEEEYVDVVQM